MGQPAVLVTFSAHFEAVRSRIRRLPRLGIELMEAGARGACLAVRDRFQEGLERDDLRLRRLKPRTVASKEARGLDRPEHPLYALGLDEPDSYANSQEVAKVGEHRWVLRTRDVWHHGKRRPGDREQRRIRLSDLFDVHEYGVTITNGFGRGVLIRIPARPARRYAYRRVARGLQKRETAYAARRAMARYVRQGDRLALARVHAKLLGSAEGMKG